MIEVSIETLGYTGECTWSIGHVCYAGVPFYTPQAAVQNFLEFCRTMGAPTHERYVLLNDDGTPKAAQCRFKFVGPNGKEIKEAK